MTIVCAVHDSTKRQTWIASDTQGRDGQDKIYDVGPKWIRFGDYAIGHAGFTRTTTLLRALAEERFAGASGPYELTERLRELFNDHGYRADQDKAGGPPFFHERFLLAAPHGLWDIDNVLALVEMKPAHMAAIGSGEDLALGCVWGLNQAKVSLHPEEVLTMCIRAAMAHDAGCGGTIYTDCVKDA